MKSKLAHFAILGVCIASVLFSGALVAQTGAGGKEMLEQKLEAIKASATANQQKLHQYMWTETTTVTVNGRQLAPKVSMAFYGPDGKVHKEPMGGNANDSSQHQPRGPLMKHVMEEKKAEMKDYAQDVGALIAMYVPPNPQKMGQAFQAKKVSFNGGNGVASLAFRDYAKPGDSMTLTADAASHAIRSLQVKSWLDSPQEPVNLTVDFATLPDGTRHPSRTVLDAPAKGLNVVTVNSGYHKGGH